MMEPDCSDCKGVVWICLAFRAIAWHDTKRGVPEVKVLGNSVSSEGGVVRDEKGHQVVVKVSEQE